MGKAASHAGQTLLYLTPLHGKADTIKALIANVGAALRQIRSIAEQFKSTDRWATMLRYISERIAPSIKAPPLLPALLAIGQLPF